jgi:hypothetical protein
MHVGIDKSAGLKGDPQQMQGLTGFRVEFLTAQNLGGDARAASVCRRCLLPGSGLVQPGAENANTHQHNEHWCEQNDTAMHGALLSSLVS